MTVSSLPFELDRDEVRGDHTGARAVHGTVTLESEAIVIAFELEDAAGTRSTDQARIPLGAVKKLVMTGGALKSPRLLLEVNDEAVLTNVPWAVRYMALMRFRRADGVALRQLIEEAEVRIARIRTRGQHD